LHNLDTVFHQEVLSDSLRFCTVIFGVLTRCQDGFDVHLASGGHPPALLLSAEGGSRYVEIPGGQAIGVSSAPRFTSTRIRLTAGDTLVLYTDGLTEARNRQGDLFGQERLIEWLRQSPSSQRTAEELKENLVAELTKFQANTSLKDDQTFLIMAE
jgi:phosphoserine phosphatase RsbU/P